MMRRGVRALSGSASRVVTQDAYINGQWISCQEFGRSFQVLDPATEEKIAEVPDMGAEEVTKAVDAAQVSVSGKQKGFWVDMSDG